MTPRHLVMIWTAGLALILLPGCPPSKPPPVHPDASDAAPAPPPVVHADCGSACTSYAMACATADAPTCSVTCGSIVPNLPGYADCLLAARSCDDGTACDHKASGAAKPVVNGH